MSYDTGLSGLQAAANDLDVIGNNIAKADTAGFNSETVIKGQKSLCTYLIRQI